MQQAVKDKQVGIAKVKGTENPSDLMTKFTDLATLEKLCTIMNLETRGGRATSAPKVAEDDRKVAGWTDEVVADVNAIDEVSDDDAAEDDCKVAGGELAGDDCKVTGLNRDSLDKGRQETDGEHFFPLPSAAGFSLQIPLAMTVTSLMTALSSLTVRRSMMAGT